MKILLYSVSHFVDTVLPLYKEMKERGYDVTCLIELASYNTTSFSIDDNTLKHGIINANDVKEMNVYKDYVDFDNIFIANYLYNGSKILRRLKSLNDIFRFIFEGHYDIIHIDNPFNNERQLLYFFRKKIVLTRHDPFEHSGMEFSRSYRKTLKKAYNKIRRIVILNKSQLKYFCVENDIQQDRVLVNSLGPYNSIKCYAENSIYEKNNNVLFFGGITRYKGLEYLCEAMMKVHKIIPDAQLTIAGSKPFYFDISPYQSLPYFHIHNRFITVTELAKFIMESSVVVCAYTDATQSGVIWTSFALNKPVIASNIDTLREVVKNGYNGLLVSPKNVDELANAIITILSNVDMRSKMSQNINYENNFGEHSWSKIVDKYIAFYKS